MSAGIDCKITVKFTPQLNKNIDTHLPIQAATGLIKIPLRCSYKKALVTAKSCDINFGEVLFGEEKEMIIELSNDGALETMAKIRDSTGRSIKDKTDKFSLTSRQQSFVQEGSRVLVDDLDEEVGPEGAGRGEPGEVSLEEEVDVYDELRFVKMFKVGGYSKYLLKVRYVPKVIRPWNTELEVSFENFMHSPPLRVTLR
jgi:hypothetical protein